MLAKPNVETPTRASPRRATPLPSPPLPPRALSPGRPVRSPRQLRPSSPPQRRPCGRLYSRLRVAAQGLWCFPKSRETLLCIRVALPEPRQGFFAAKQRFFAAKKPCRESGNGFFAAKKCCSASKQRCSAAKKLSPGLGRVVLMQRALRPRSSPVMREAGRAVYPLPDHSLLSPFYAFWFLPAKMSS